MIYLLSFFFAFNISAQTFEQLKSQLVKGDIVDITFKDNDSGKIHIKSVEVIDGENQKIPQLHVTYEYTLYNKSDPSHSGVELYNEREKYFWIDKGTIFLGSCPPGYKCMNMNNNELKKLGSITSSTVFGNGDDCYFVGEVHFTNLAYSACYDKVICTGQVRCDTNTIFVSGEKKLVVGPTGDGGPTVYTSCLAYTIGDQYVCPSAFLCGSDEETILSINENRHSGPGQKVSVPIRNFVTPK